MLCLFKVVFDNIKAANVVQRIGVNCIRVVHEAFADIRCLQQFLQPLCPLSIRVLVIPVEHQVLRVDWRVFHTLPIVNLLRVGETKVRRLEVADG